MKTKIREQFPFFEENSDICYFDNANTTQILGPSLSSMIKYYYNYNYNYGRAAYEGVKRNEKMLDISYEVFAKFLNTKKENLIFTSGTTESMNIIANSLCQKLFMQKRDKKAILLTTELEHASSVLPFMVLGKKYIDIKYIPLDEKYSFSLETLEQEIIKHRPDFLLLSSMTNTTGEIRDIESIGTLAKNYNIIFIVDHAQGASHFLIDTEKSNIDYLAFSMHKAYGPKGVGILFAKNLNEIIPTKFGGGMNEIFDTDGKYSFLKDKDRLWAGTQNLPGIFASLNSINFLYNNIIDIRKRETFLGAYCYRLLSTIPGIKLYSAFPSPIILFNIEGYESFEIMNFLNKNNIYIRAGNHCSKLTKDLFGLSTCRISLSIYNTEEEINKLYKILKQMVSNGDEECLKLEKEENVQEETNVKLNNAAQKIVR